MVGVGRGEYIHHQTKCIKQSILKTIFFSPLQGRESRAIKLQAGEEQATNSAHDMGENLLTIEANWSC